ncbi:MAG TPA: TrmO family methyltransferase [Acidobacteriota bacterium]|nr:TrmO family methyltransferase [Acidobacteriota bacterium]
MGFPVVRPEESSRNTLVVSSVDMVDGTPLLDIKPYVPEFDSADDVRTGWINRTD